jgi:hypothetical protein
MSAVEKSCANPMLSARLILAVEPVIQRRGTESPELTDVRSVNLATARHLLQCLRMNSQQGRGLRAVEQWLKFRN